MGERQNTPGLQLDVQRIIKTVATLQSRIEERFPGSGLGQPAGRLHTIAADTVEDLRRALHFLRQLRALAHIIDMHQLTKDPDRVVGGAGDTRSSPRRELDRFLIGRYLDYCSELLSLVSKVAALYAQSFDDPVVLAAVDEVEGLTTGLSGKIWQKIIIVDQTASADRAFHGQGSVP